MNQIDSNLYHRSPPFVPRLMRPLTGLQTTCAKIFSVMISTLFVLLPGAGLAWAQGSAEYGISISGAGVGTSATGVGLVKTAKKLRRRPAKNNKNNKTVKSLHIPLQLQTDEESPNAESSDSPAKEDQAVTGPGKLLVRSKPTGALVWIDGKPAGTTPLLVALDPGKYSIEVRGSRMAAAKQEITLKANESRKLLLQVKPRYPRTVKLGRQLKLGDK